jgi:hypothetical protein
VTVLCTLFDSLDSVRFPYSLDQMRSGTASAEEQLALRASSEWRRQGWPRRHSDRTWVLGLVHVLLSQRRATSGRSGARWHWWPQPGIGQLVLSGYAPDAHVVEAILVAAAHFHGAQPKKRRAQAHPTMSSMLQPSWGGGSSRVAPLRTIRTAHVPLRSSMHGLVQIGHTDA